MDKDMARRLDAIIGLLEEQNQVLKALVKGKRKKSPPVPTKTAWTAYEWAFRRVYGTFPERSGSLNAVMAAIVRELGSNAPHVIYYYLSDNDYYIRQNMHSLKILKAKLELYMQRWKQCREETGADVPQGSVFNLDHAIRETDNWREINDLEQELELKDLPRRLEGVSGVKFGA